MKQVCPFKVPDEKMRMSALGSLTGALFRIRKSIKAILPLFSPIPEPKPSDWLWEHSEDGQSYEVYKSSPINWIKKPKNVIYIQALESSITADFIAKLKLFCEAFYYGVEVKIRKSIEVEKLGVPKRINEYTQKIQYHAGEILRKLENGIPADCYCLIGLMMSDIYPRDEWNFVFGLASLKNRTGVFSFARYDENFFENRILKPVDLNLILIRSIKVMVHEIGHMFGLKHCIYFACVMNGSNHLEENQKKPMELCPVCVRKLQENVKFDLWERYNALAKACLETESEVFKPDADLYSKFANLIKDALKQHSAIKSSKSMEEIKFSEK